MKLRLKPFVIAMGALGLSTTVYANTNAQVAQELKAVNQEMQQLQGQVKQLRGQVSTLKAKLHNKKTTKVHYVATGKPAMVAQHQPIGAKLVHHTTNAGQPKGNEVLYHTNDFGTAVVTAPYTGVPAFYDGSQLLVNAPSINEDVKLMLRQEQENAYYKKQGLGKPKHPRLVLSGTVQGIAQYTKPYRGPYNSDLDLTTAELDALADITPWVRGLMTFAYQNSANSTISANRTSNSNVYIDKAFITIGDLTKSPFYGSLGQMYVPFGRYGSGMVSSPVTEFVGKTKARALLLGFHPKGDATPYAEAFLFRSASGNRIGRVNAFGADAGYHFITKHTNGDFGASYISNIADSLGMQSNGLTGSNFQGFGQNSTAERLNHKVAGADLHATYGMGPFTFLGEYVTALRKFSRADMTYKSHGAQPSALHAEVDYTFNMFGLPSALAVAYGFTNQALALNLPKQRFGVTIESAIYKYTLLSLEFRHDINYGKGASATGNNANAFTSNELGKSQNVVTAQLAVYF